MGSEMCIRDRHNTNDRHVKVTIVAGEFVVQGANGYTNCGYCCGSQHERYITAKRKKKKRSQKQMAARNDTSEQPRTILVYDMITIIGLMLRYVRISY